MIYTVMDKKQVKREAAKSVDRLLNVFRREYWELAPFLDLLKPKEGKLIDAQTGKSMDFAFSTDGKYLYYNPEHIERYDNPSGKILLMSELLHTLHHCILGDPEKYRECRAKKLFDAYVDLRVEYLVKTFYIPRGWCEFSVENYIGEKSLPESFYRLRHHKSMCSQLRRNADVLHVDEHAFWEMQTDPKVWDKWRQLTAGDRKDIDKNEERRFHKAEGIAKQIYEQGREKKYGNWLGEREEEINAAKENNNCYTDVLKDFMKEETEREDPYSIDLMIYSYGMELYQDVALIEPAEDCVPVDIGKLAIAIDTSGSCGGFVASAFLRELSNLLRDICSAGTTGELLLYQCDCDIAKKERISDLDSLKDDIETMSFYGFGGTAFEPVFDDIRLNEEQVKGLFYLTDGYGSYPEYPPDYPVYFLVPYTGQRYDEDDSLREFIPDWIQVLPIKISVSEGEGWI